MKVAKDWDIKAWAEQNAGKKKSFLGLNGKKLSGNVAGYDPAGRRIVFDGGFNAPSYRTSSVFFDGFNPQAKAYRWIYPGDVVDDSGFVIEHKVQLEKKVIDDYPHQCPRCKGKAYIGFMTTIECKAKCSNVVP